MCQVKVVLQGYPRYPNSHDLSKNRLNFDSKKLSVITMKDHQSNQDKIACYHLMYVSNYNCEAAEVCLRLKDHLKKMVFLWLHKLLLIPISTELKLGLLAGNFPIRSWKM